MKSLQIGLNTPTLVAAGVAVLLAVVVARKAKAAAAAVGTAINPVSHDNLANRAANGVFQSVYNPGNDPRKSDTLGTWVAGWFDTYNPNADVPAATLPTNLRSQYGTGILQR